MNATDRLQLHVRERGKDDSTLRTDGTEHSIEQATKSKPEGTTTGEPWHRLTKKPIQRFEEIEILSQPKLEQLALKDEYGIHKSDSELEVALYELQEQQMKERRQGTSEERVMKETIDAYHDIAKHPKIKYEFSPPGKEFKQSIMEKYVKYSPFTY